MASVCISECINNACIVPATQPTYVNLQRWAEEEKWSAERRRPRPRAADGISRRQMYLKSYTFSREDTHVSESTSQNCLGRLRLMRRRRSRCRCFSVVRASSGAFLSMVRRWLCCVAKVNGRRSRP